MKKQIILLFTLGNCSNCPQAKEIVQKLCAERGISLQIIDAENNKDAVEYGVKSVPTVISLVNGKKYGQVSGTITVDKLDEMLR